VFLHFLTFVFVSNFSIVASWCSKFTLAEKIKNKETFDEIFKANDHAPYCKCRNIRSIDWHQKHASKSRESIPLKRFVTNLYHVCSDQELDVGASVRSIQYFAKISHLLAKYGKISLNLKNHKHRSHVYLRYKDEILAKNHFFVKSSEISYPPY
jgi:hypothetical protein